jgi:probable HAF family extracellular repeat protein
VQFHLQRLEDRWCPSAYNIIDLGTLGGTNSYAYGINSAGHVVGGAQLAGDGSGHAFLYSGVLPPTDLGTLPGDVNSDAVALNNSDQVVGVSSPTGSAFPTHAFLWQSSTGMIPLVGLGGSDTEPQAINTTGQVVGFGTTTAGAHHAWIWQSSTGMVDLNTLIPSNSGWVLNDASGINDTQQIVGQGSINGQPHAFLWQFSPVGGGAPTDLGVLKGGSQSWASAINANGQVAGTCITTSGHETTWDPFLWTSPGPMTNLGTLKGATETHAYALNDLKSVQVVGSSNAAAPGDAVLWQNGKVIDLNTQIPGNSGWSVLEIAYGINHNGLIVGYGQLSPGAIWHAFLLTPPGTTPAGVLTSAGPATASAVSLIAAPSAATFSTAVVIGLPATSPLTEGTALAPAPFLDAAHSSGPPSSMPTIGQALSAPRQAQFAPHIVFAEAADDDGVFGDLGVRFVSSSPDFKN